MENQALPGIKLFDLSGKAAIITGGSKGLGLAMAEGLASIRRALVVPPIAIAGAGLFLAALSGVASLLFGDVFLTGQWWIPQSNPELKYISTVVLFDIGVYLVVVGSIVAIALALEERD